MWVLLGIDENWRRRWQGTFPTDGIYFIYEVKRYSDGETSRNPLGNMRRENIRIGMPDILNAVSTCLRINTPVTKESPRMVAIFNIALTSAYHHTLYKSHKYLLRSAYVPGTILRSGGFYKTRRRGGSLRSSCSCQVAVGQGK